MILTKDHTEAYYKKTSKKESKKNARGFQKTRTGHKGLGIRSWLSGRIKSFRIEKENNFDLEF